MFINSVMRDIWTRFVLATLLMPKDTSKDSDPPRFTTTYKPPTGRARLFGFAPIRGIRRTPNGTLLDRCFTGPVEKVEDPISKGDTTQWDIDHGFVDPPPNYYWLSKQEPSKTKQHGEKDDVPAPLRPIRSVSFDDRGRKLVHFVSGPVERILVSTSTYML
jgi:hypothetical protein